MGLNECDHLGVGRNDCGGCKGEAWRTKRPARLQPKNIVESGKWALPAYF